MKSRAQVLGGPGEFELRDMDVGSPGPGEVRLRVLACGICGSDKMLSQVSAPGTILGHEIVAEVESCGAGVSDWQPGDRAIPIGEGVGIDTPGGYGELILTPAARCVRVPRDLPILTAVLGEPLGNGLHFVRRSRMRGGERVAILGAGQIGLSTLFWARRAGAARIVVTEPARRRAQLARDLGADAVLNPADAGELGEAVVEALGGRPQVVFEAVGTAAVMQDALWMVDSGGGVVVLAGITTDEIPIRPLALCLKETDVVFPLGTVAEEVAEVISVLWQGEFPAARFVTHRIPQAEIPKAIDGLGRPTDQIKVVIDYAGERA